MKWTAPPSDGGARITGYYLEKCDVATTDRWVRACRIPIKELTYQVDDLIKGKEYMFRVTAENKVGTGPESEPSDTFVAKLPYGKFQ